MLLKGKRTFVVRDMDGFIAHINMPGWVKAIPSDHGHGPLAMVVESILRPGRLIAMHEHRNDEIISWVPDGVMRHEDRSRGRLTIDSEHLMVMNSGTGFWHSEETTPYDPPLRMLQILVRPWAINLEPGIQHGALPPMTMNCWRHLVGPEGTNAPFYVRNQVDMFDVRLEAGARVQFPNTTGRDLYFYVFEGSITCETQVFAEGEQGLLPSDDKLTAEATSACVMVAFLLDMRSPVTRKGTVADHRKIPPPLIISLLKQWQRLQQWWRRT